MRVRIRKLNDSTGAFPTHKGIKCLLWLGHKIPHPRNSSRLAKLQFSAENLPCHPEASNGRCAFTRSHNQEGTRKPGIGTSLYLFIGTENQNPEETQVHHNSPYVYKLREGKKNLAARVDA